MVCRKCNAVTQTIGRFCTSCGSPTVEEHDVKAPSDVTVAWLAEILASQGYSNSFSESDPNIIFSKHEQRTNVCIVLKPGYLITVESWWGTKVPRQKRNDFLAALNMANCISWYCTCHTSDNKFEDVSISTFVCLPERYSSRDFCRLLDVYEEGLRDIFAKSGLMDYSK